MTSEKNRDYQRLAIAAARMLCDNERQVEIARKLGKSQPEISRLLAYAEKHEYMSRQPTMLRQHIEDEDWNEVEQRHFGDVETAEALRRLAPRDVDFDVRVFSGSYDDFTYAAAGRVVELLPRSQRIGILWGRTIFQVLKGVSARSGAFDRAGMRHMQCVPLCGDPLYLMNQRLLEYSASWLAASLEQTLTGADNPDIPCLTGVPAYISTRVAEDADTINGWAEFVRRIPGYRRIFGDGKSRSGLVDELDTAITGAGIIVKGQEKAEASTGDFIKERLEQEEIGKEALDKLVYGEIGGFLLEREGLSSKDRRTVEELNRGWTGVNGEHLERIGQTAGSGDRPGIILIARGASKGLLVHNAIKRGFVNRLIIDPTLATRLKKL